MYSTLDPPILFSIVLLILCTCCLLVKRWLLWWRYSVAFLYSARFCSRLIGASAKRRPVLGPSVFPPNKGHLQLSQHFSYWNKYENTHFSLKITHYQRSRLLTMVRGSPSLLYFFPKRLDDTLSPGIIAERHVLGTLLAACSSVLDVSAVCCGLRKWRTEGGFGIQTPPPPKFWRPSKIVPNSTRLWKLLKKLLNLGRQNPKMFWKNSVKF